MFKKVISVMLAALILSAVLSTAVFAEDENAEEAVTEIRTAEDLYMINLDLSGSYRLMNDIDLSEATAEGGDRDYGGRGWEPIGSDGTYSGDTPFSGVFDGNGYEISGLRIDIDTLPSGTVSAYVGLFSKNTGTIENLTVSGSITTNADVYCAGAIAGYNSGIIEGCANKADINISNRILNIYASGIAGINDSDGTISQCYNTGNIEANSKSDVYNGIYNISVASGISMSYGVMIDCYNAGTITASNLMSSLRDCAGINAHYSSTNPTVKTTNCYNIGSATKAISYNRVTNCYFMDGSGAGTSGAISLTDTQMKLKALYNGFDFDNVWYISGDYPYPQLRRNPQYDAPDEETTAPTEALTAIDTVTISSIWQGDFAAEMPVGDCEYKTFDSRYRIADHSEGYWSKGMLWHDDTADKDVERYSDKYEIGHTYTVSFMLQADDGYCFADDVTAYINADIYSDYPDHTAEVYTDESYPGYILVKYTYPYTAQWPSSAPEPETEAPPILIDTVWVRSVSDQDMTADHLVGDYYGFGTSGGNYGIMDHNEGYWDSGILWHDDTTDKYIARYSQYYEANHIYTVTFILEPDIGYCFDNNVTAYVNGSPYYGDKGYEAEVYTDRNLPGCILVK